MEPSKSCRNGHTTGRYATSGRCKGCQKASNSKAFAKNGRRYNMAARLRSDHKRRGMPEATRTRAAACESCGSPPGTKGLYLDHCHITGQFRGWLCFKCNVGIGHLGDCSAGVTAANEYLKKFENSLI